MGFFRPSDWGVANNKGPTLARCGKCGLAKRCFSPRMAPTGKGRLPILFVAEAPGEQEDKRGTQLVGDSGKLLRQALSEMDLDLEDCLKTNAVICRPPDNKMDPLYIDCCRPNLIKTICDFGPRVIVLMGMSAVSSLIGQEWKRDLDGLSKWAGWHIPSPFAKAWVVPTYHPSFILRSNDDPTLLMFLKQHLREAFALAKKEFVLPATVQDLSKRVEVIANPRQAVQRIMGLYEKDGILAFDYETTGLKPDHPDQRIVACSFCLNGEDTFACMMDERCLKALSQVLRSDRLAKVASNLKFEERWTKAKLGHGVTNWHWDTMLAAHVLDNRPGITSIKFQSYIRLGIPDYDSTVRPFLEAEDANGFNRIGQANQQDLLVYNGLDSSLEFKVAELQKKEMGYGVGVWSV